jgi:DNA polymerase-3 subunit alpha
LQPSHTFPCGCVWPVTGPPPVAGAAPRVKVDLQHLPDCPAVWALFATGRTRGVFQLDKNLGCTWSKRLRPETLEHLAALGALLRPGCLRVRGEDGLSMTERYAKVKNGEMALPKSLPPIADIMDPNYGVMLYQEGLVKIAERVALFDLQEQDKLRKGVGKKIQAVIAECKTMFLDKARAAGVITEEESQKLWNDIEKSGRYLFNRSHAFSYAIPGYFSAYLKAHDPTAFFCAWLRCSKIEQDKSPDDIAELVEDAKLFDVPVLPPDFRRLDRHFQTDAVRVWFGIADIRGVGDAQVEKLRQSVKEEEAAGRRPRESWEQFLVGCANSVSTTTVRGLINSGGFDWVGRSRTRLLHEYEAFARLSPKELEWARARPAGESVPELLRNAAKPKKEGGGAANVKRREILNGLADTLERPLSSEEDSPRWLAAVEKYYLAAAVTCSAVDAYDTSAATATCREAIDGVEGDIVMGVEIRSVRTHKIKSGDNAGKKMAYMTVGDHTGVLADVKVFSEAFAKYGHLLVEDNVVLLKGYCPKDGGFAVKEVSQL